MQRSVKKLLFDILEASLAITQFSEGKTSEEYEHDLLLRSGIERQFIIIGEGMNRLSRIDPSIANTMPACRTIVDFRNLLIHGYDIINN